jgi:sugar lactone lactonase YvrE
MVFDSKRNLLIARGGEIFRLSPAGILSKLVGATHLTGPSPLSYVHAITIDRNDNAYVLEDADIKKIAADGTLSTFVPGSAQLSASALDIDAAGNLYVADSNNSVIRKITPDGSVSILAGTLGTPGTLDGSSAAALFQYPTGIAVQTDGTILVADNGAATLRAISPTGIVTTVAGAAHQSASVDGTGEGARFSALNRITLDASGGLFATDGNAIRHIDSSFRVATLAGVASAGGYADGTGSNALFWQPNGLRREPDGNVLVADTLNNVVREMTPAGTVSTLFGAPANIGGIDAKGSQARFDNPEGVAISASGYVYVADTSNMTIRRIAPDGTVITYAGTPGTSGYKDGPAQSALFALPAAVAVDSDETLYVADYANCAIRKIAPDRTVSTLASNPSSFGIASYCSFNTQPFSGPTGIALDANKNVLVADPDNNYIVKVTPNGAVAILAGQFNVAGSTDGPLSTALFNQPFGIAVDGHGDVYIADSANHTIRAISPQGMVTTLAGVAGQDGSVDGTGTGALLSRPSSLAIDPTGVIYFPDYDFATIRRVTPEGVVTTVAGTPETIGTQLGPLPGVMWPPMAIAAYPDPVGGKLAVTYAASILTVNLH